MNNNIGKIKKKIADIFKADEKKVIIVHKGEKISNNDKRISECGMLVFDSLLVIINGLCDW